MGRGVELRIMLARVRAESDHIGSQHGKSEDDGDDLENSLGMHLQGED